MALLEDFSVVVSLEVDSAAPDEAGALASELEGSLTVAEDAGALDSELLTALLETF
jgi:hypothetical protein